MHLLREIIREHIEYRKQIFKLAKSDVIKTYRGAALRLGMGYYKTSSYHIRILVCFCYRAKGISRCKLLPIFSMVDSGCCTMVLYERNDYRWN